MKEGEIRPLGLCLFRRGRSILVVEGYDEVKDEVFYRPPGGGIEFGETSQEAAIREIREELGAEVTNLRLLGTFENIFTYMGKPGHEIVFVYEADLVDRSLYEQTELEINENGEVQKGLWVSLDEFKAGRFPLYPDGLLSILYSGLQKH